MPSSQSVSSGLLLWHSWDTWCPRRVVEYIRPKLRQLEAGLDLLDLLRFSILWDWQAISDDLFKVSLLLQLH